MDLSLVTAALGAQTGLTQLSLAGSMLKMNAQNASSVVKLIDAAQQTMNSLANVAPGVGTNLDISVQVHLSDRISNLIVTRRLDPRLHANPGKPPGFRWAKAAAWTAGSSPATMMVRRRPCDRDNEYRSSTPTVGASRRRSFNLAGVTCRHG